MTGQSFPIVPAGKLAIWFTLAIGLVTPLAVAVVMVYAAHGSDDWQRAAPALLILPIIGGILAWSLHGRRVEIDAGTLVLRRGPFPKKIAIAQFDLAQATIVDLNLKRELQPVMKIAGSGLPGYRAGWFWLRNRRKAWVLLTDWRRVLVLGKRDGGLVLLSPERPDALLDALRRAGNFARP